MSESAFFLLETNTEVCALGFALRMNIFFSEIPPQITALGKNAT